VESSRSVAVVIPSWNSLVLLRRCLDSLCDQGVELETTVIDNGSDDGTAEYLEREGVSHVSLPENVGFAPAVNLGIERTSAPSVFVLNADTVLESGALGRLAEALAADPALGGVQPRLLQLEEGAEMDVATARLYSVGQRLSRDGRGFEIGAGEEQGEISSGPREVFGVCGAACLFRRELLEQLGGYDERYFAFYEDVDLNVRARIVGWRFGYVPEAVVWHVGNATWTAQAPRASAWNAQLVARNRIATQLKFMSLRTLPRVLLVEAGALARAARERRLRATLRGKLEGLRWTGEMRRERRRLSEEGDLELAREWLGR
jgi:GT2 family glycosyltransferase